MWLTGFSLELTTVRIPSIVGGERILPDEGLQSDVNPADKDDVVALFPSLTRNHVIQAIEIARESFASWASIPAPERGKILVKASNILENESEELARILTREEGKTINESRAEVSRAISIFRFYGVMAYRLRGEYAVSSEKNTHLFTIREPIGVVSVITPWNFPIAIPSWKIAPALLCGNTVVFKPASYTPFIAYKLVEALLRAGIPPGTINYVTGSGGEVGAELITNPYVDAVSFTGSLEVGQTIREYASSKNMRVQLEMGGKNPAVVLEDADLDKSVEMIVKAAFGLTGQACTATSRVIVLDRVAEDFERKLIERVKRIKVGNGLVDGVEMGPVVGEKELRKILSYVELGREEGAKLLYGGNRLTQGHYAKGFFMEPAVFTDVSPDMKIAQEEIFGPVLSVMRVRNFDEAVEVANNTEYGLSASLFTNSLSKAFSFINQIQAGIVKINKPTTGLEPHVPFGGYKKSSLGMMREQGEAAIDFYTKIKTVYLGV